jgi:hypothetical protein
MSKHKMIDLRPPYPWEKQPEKPKQGDNPLEIAAMFVMIPALVWTLFMLLPAFG